MGRMKAEASSFAVGSLFPYGVDWSHILVGHGREGILDTQWIAFWSI